MTHRPTTLRLATDFCLAALDHYDRGVNLDPDVFATGTAAHEILEAAARGDRTETEVVETLLGAGRSGEDATPPLPADSVFAGRRLARAWLEAYPIPEGALAEHRFAFDPGWRSVAWDDAGPFGFRTRIDLVFRTTFEDEDGFEVTTLHVRDYKTSWAIDGSTLDPEPPLQQRAQAVAAWRSGLADDAGAISIELANLRRRTVYTKTITLDEEGLATLERWAEDVSSMMRAASMTPRRPSPGLRCLGCPFAYQCAAAANHVAEGEEILGRFVAAREMTKGLEAEARAFMADRDPVDREGTRIGFIESTSRQIKPGALVDALQRLAGDLPPDVEAAAAALEVKLGSTWLNSAAGVIFGKRGQEAKANRDQWLDERTRTETRPRWTVKRS